MTKKELHKQLRERVESEKPGASLLWKEELPHFGGGLPHRYQNTADEYLPGAPKVLVCRYCLRPKGNIV